jgi:hypothetical protein
VGNPPTTRTCEVGRFLRQRSPSYLIIKWLFNAFESSTNSFLGRLAYLALSTWLTAIGAIIQLMLYRSFWVTVRLPRPRVAGEGNAGLLRVPSLG